MVQSFIQSSGGDYAAASTIAKLVFHATYPVAALAYPHSLAMQGYEQRLRVIALAALAIGAISFGLALMIGVPPQRVVELFFARRFGWVIPYIGPLTLAVARFSLSAFGFEILIAFSSHWGFVTSQAAVALRTVLYALRHESLAAVINDRYIV